MVNEGYKIGQRVYYINSQKERKYGTVVDKNIDGGAWKREDLGVIVFADWDKENLFYPKGPNYGWMPAKEVFLYEPKHRRNLPHWF